MSLRDRQIAIERGIGRQEAARLAALRVFSSEPGAYGAGLFPLIDGGNWESNRDLVNVFADGAGSLDSGGTAEEQTTCSVPGFPKPKWCSKPG